jgi:hypothetical protein
MRLLFPDESPASNPPSPPFFAGGSILIGVGVGIGVGIVCFQVVLFSDG